MMVDDDHEMPKLPIPHEKLDELVEGVKDRARKLGLYVESLGVGTSLPPDYVDEDHEIVPTFVLVGQFTIGKQAFSKRVQNPEDEQMSDAFRELEVRFYDDGVDEIRKRYENGGFGLAEEDEDE